MQVSNFLRFRTGELGHRDTNGFLDGHVGMTRKLSCIARASKSFGEAHPTYGETKTQQVEGVCHATGTPSFTLDTMIPIMVLWFATFCNKHGLLLIH